MVFTYCMITGLTHPGIDHVLCSGSVDQLISNIDIMYKLSHLTHKPVVVSIHDIDVAQADVEACSYNIKNSMLMYPDWSKLDDYSLVLYQHELDRALSSVDIPAALINGHSCDIDCA